MTQYNKTPGALVSIVANKDGIYRVIFKCTVWVQRRSEKKTSVSHESKTASLFVHVPAVPWSHEARDLHHGEYRPVDQQWVIH